MCRSERLSHTIWYGNAPHNLFYLETVDTSQVFLSPMPNSY